MNKKKKKSEERKKKKKIFFFTRVLIHRCALFFLFVSIHIKYSLIKYDSFNTTIESCFLFCQRKPSFPSTRFDSLGFFFFSFYVFKKEDPIERYRDHLCGNVLCWRVRTRFFSVCILFFFLLFGTRQKKEDRFEFGGIKRGDVFSSRKVPSSRRVRSSSCQKCDH